MNPYCMLANGRVADIEQVEDMITSYIAVHCGLRGLNPDSISKTYLPGIAGTLDKKRSGCRHVFRCATHSKEVKLVLKGFKRSFDEMNPKANNIVLPYGYDLALKSKIVSEREGLFGGADVNILVERVFVCQVVGITFLLRKSEHIVKKTKHGYTIPLCRNHITFFDKQNKPIAYEQIGKIQSWTVVLNVRFAKADQSG